MQEKTGKTFFDQDSLKDCVQCGECTSTCPRHRFDTRFNPRKWMSRFRNVNVEDLMEDRSLWSCMKCFRCADVCRRQMSPAEELMKMRRLVMKKTLYKDAATRHAQAFIDNIGATGKLNEAFLPLKTLHFRLLQMVPMTLRMISKGKVPPLRVEKVDQLNSLKSIFRDFA